MLHFWRCFILCTQCNGLTYTGVDFLFFRKNFDFSGEDELITWYTHLRSAIAISWSGRGKHKPNQQTKPKVLNISTASPDYEIDFVVKSLSLTNNYGPQTVSYTHLTLPTKRIV